MKVKLQHSALDQFQVLVDGNQVGLVCYGNGPDRQPKPFKWLKSSRTFQLMNVEERIAVARYVREQMPAISARCEQLVADAAAALGLTVPQFIRQQKMPAVGKFLAGHFQHLKDSDGEEISVNHPRPEKTTAAPKLQPARQSAAEGESAAK